MPETWNPGELIIDQATGDCYIDPDTGDGVVAAPGLQVETLDGRTLDGDDVVGAVWLELNIFEGEIIRDRKRGTPYQRVIFDASSSAGLAATVMAGQASTVRGVGSVTSTRLLTYDADRRVLVFACALRKKDGPTVPAVFGMAG